MSLPLLGTIPELADGGLRLRLWKPGDGETLSAAWHDPAIIAGSRPPSDRSVEAAERWIVGCAPRWERGVAFDLVVEVDGVVAGEVGLARLHRERRAAEIGWWVGEQHRGQGVATTAVGLVTNWALSVGGLRAIFAEIGNDNPASMVVAERSGYRRVAPPRNPQENEGVVGPELWYVALSTVK